MPRSLELVPLRLDKARRAARLHLQLNKGLSMEVCTAWGVWRGVRGMVCAGHGMCVAMVCACASWPWCVHVHHDEWSR